MTHAQLVERLVKSRGNYYTKALNLATREAIVEARDRTAGYQDTTQRNRSLAAAVVRFDRKGTARRKQR